MLKDLLTELRKYERAEVAYKSGVSIGTINALMSGANKDPKLSTLTALQSFLDSKEKEK